MADDADVWSLNNLGLIYIEQGRSKEAVGPLARAVQLRSNQPVFQNNLGVALERSGYPVAAAQAYETAIKADSTYTKAAVALARVTGAGQQPESGSLDLSMLAQEFLKEIEEWRHSVEVLQPAADSTHSAIQVSSDSLEQDCAHGE
jgi:predicted Zn-dependent protease